MAKITRCDRPGCKNETLAEKEYKRKTISIYTITGIACYTLDLCDTCVNDLNRCILNAEDTWYKALANEES
jgi:hypothetical protein